MGSPFLDITAITIPALVVRERERHSEKYSIQALSDRSTQGMAREGRGGACSFVACRNHWQLATHLFRGVASFLLTMEIIPTAGRSLRFPHIFLHVTFSLILSPSCLAFRGDHVSPRIAIVFSLLASVSNFFSHIGIFTSPPPKHPVSSFRFHILPPCEFSYHSSCRKGTPMHLLSPLADYWNTSLFFLSKTGPLHEIAASASSRSPLYSEGTFSFLCYSLNIATISKCSSPALLSFLTLSFPLIKYFLIYQGYVLYPPNFSKNIVSCSWFSPISFHTFSTTLCHQLHQLALLMLSLIQPYQLWLEIS